MLGKIMGWIGGDTVKKIGNVLDNLTTSDEERMAAEAAIRAIIADENKAMLEATSSIITAEATGKSWMQRNWRPLTMLTFVALIVARWLGYSAPNLSEAEVLKLWDIVQLGIGGYVIGRSAEKIVPMIGRR